MILPKMPADIRPIINALVEQIRAHETKIQQLLSSNGGYMGYAVLPKQFYQGQLGSSSATLYTAPTGSTGNLPKKAKLREVIVANTDTVAYTYTLYIVESGGSISNARKIFPEVSIAANTTHQHTLDTTLESGATLRGLASSASKLTVTASGEELL